MARIDHIEVCALRVPTETPESDGTLRWRSTTMVAVEVCASGVRGLGYTYSHAAAATLIRDELAQILRDADPMNISAIWAVMRSAARNIGTSGLVAEAMSAVDVALWDLKARLLGVPLCVLLGTVHDSVPIYGSGGFTSLGIDELQAHMRAWIDAGIPRVKMKVGRHPEHDVERVRAVRAAIGEDAELYVDANGAYERKQALAMAERFAEHGVTWLEEPVSSEDIDGLRWVRDRAPAGMVVAAGEYGFGPEHVRQLAIAGAVDVAQADITRCQGLSGLVQAHALCDAFSLPMSTHCAQALHVHPAASMSRIIHIECFHDHARLEPMVLIGVPEPRQGTLTPDLTRTGHGLELRREEVVRHAV